ncbi:MAG: ferritin-like domain-containing protein [Deltaproteobacteria bacterium]|nr:ferritin-like domain-containing protein [Deltaproteobacteria bacterium]
MKTSEAWWAETKSDPAAMASWLRDQYRGEATAAGRIEALRDAFALPSSREHRVLGIIAAQERRHAAWVAELLAARGIEVVVDDIAERYWPEVTKAVLDLATGAAVGAHAERMRLERIEAIASDPGAPEDVRAVFARILPEERFHERAFRSIAGEDAMRRTAHAHALGRAVLGLAP